MNLDARILSFWGIKLGWQSTIFHANANIIFAKRNSVRKLQRREGRVAGRNRAHPVCGRGVLTFQTGHDTACIQFTATCKRLHLRARIITRLSINAANCRGSLTRLLAIKHFHLLSCLLLRLPSCFFKRRFIIVFLYHSESASFFLTIKLNQNHNQSKSNSLTITHHRTYSQSHSLITIKITLIHHHSHYHSHSLYHTHPCSLCSFCLTASAFPYWFPTLTSHLVCPSRAWWTSGTFLGSSKWPRRGEAAAGSCGPAGEEDLRGWGKRWRTRVKQEDEVREAKRCKGNRWIRKKEEKANANSRIHYESLDHSFCSWNTCNQNSYLSNRCASNCIKYMTTIFNRRRNNVKCKKKVATYI